jgi:hypothetical protein
MRGPVMKTARRSVVMTFLLGLVLALPACSGGAGPTTAVAGDCLVEAAGADDMNVVECADAEAKWSVLAVADTTDGTVCADQPDGDIYLTFEDEGRSVCLRLLGAVGDCAWTDFSGLADCEEDSGYQLAEILEDTDDEAGCPAETEQVRVYSDPSVYCWVRWPAS